jgi:hypothetical protein
MIENIGCSWSSLMPFMYDHQHMSSDYGVLVVQTHLPKAYNLGVTNVNLDLCIVVTSYWDYYSARLR